MRTVLACTTARVLLVGMPSFVRDGLRAVLTRDEGLRIVGEVDELSKATEALRHHEGVDVVVVDTESVEPDWTDRVRELCAPTTGPAPRVLLLSVSLQDGDLARSAAAGVSGWILKNEGATHLIAAVRAVAQGQAWLSPPIARQFLDHVRATGLRHGGTPAPDDAARLSRREQSVLRLLAQGRSNAEIAQALVLSEATIKTHVSRLLTKLAVSNRVKLAAYAFRHGLAE